MNERARLWGFISSGVVAIVLGFLTFEPGRKIELLKFTGWWFLAATFVLFTAALWSVLKACSWAWVRDRREWLALSSVPLAAGAVLAHEPAGFKIIMDEIMLLGSSMSLHLDRLLQVPMRGHDIGGAFVIVDGLVDKRPGFFPFLLSLVHDATGYRPENAFRLNAVLASVLFAVVYAIGRTLAGRAAAVAAVVLLGGLPLLAQSATGGGFDLLNLLLLAVVLWLTLRFVARPAKPELTALCLATVLLAQTRYESVLYVAPCAAVVGWTWWRQRRASLSWPVVVAPLLMLPVPWLLTMFRQGSPSWETASQAGAPTPLALAHVTENLRHAARFFFATGGAQPNSLLFAALGVFSLFVIAGRLVLRRRAGESPTGETMAVAVFGSALVAQFVLLMAYFWGKFDDPVIARLSLPTHLLFLLALWRAVPVGRTGQRVWLAVIALGLVQWWTLSVPAMASHAYTQQNVHAREVEWRREFMARQAQRDYLVVDPYSVVWLTHRISSTSPAQAKRQPKAIAHHLRARSFASVFVFQRFEIDPDTGRQTLRPEFEVGTDFDLESVAECRLQPYTVSRISRVTAVREVGSATQSR